MNKRINYCLSGIILFFMTGCESCKGKPNLEDKTPPVIEWTVTNQDTGDERKVNGTASLNYPAGSKLTVIGCVVDDGGVQELISVQNSAYSCTNGQLGQQVGPGLVVPETIPLGLDQDGKAWIRYCKIHSLTFDFQCQQGFSLSSAYYSFQITGKNYAGLTSTGTLTLRVPS